MQRVLYDNVVMSDLFDESTDSVILFKPVTTDDNVISDFEIAYCNNASSQFLGAPVQVVLGQTIFNTSLLDDNYKETLFNQCLSVWQTGKPFEEPYASQIGGRHFSTLKRKITAGVLSVTKEKTENLFVEKSSQQTALFANVLDASAEGVMILEAIRNEEGEVTDFRLAHCNKVACQLGKISPTSFGKTMIEILPHLKSSTQLLLHKKVIETGLPERIETTFRNEKGEEYGWFIVSLMKMGDNVISTFIDVSADKKNREKIEEQSGLLNSIFEASINGIFACEAIRNETGEIIDLQIIKINTAFTRSIGIPAEVAVGASYHSLFPSGRRTGMFSRYCVVIETGENLREEVYYDDEKIRGWYDVSAVKMGSNGIVITFANITENRLNREVIQEGSRYLQDVIDSSQTGILLLSPVRSESGEITDFMFKITNQTLATFTGMRPTELTGKLHNDVFPEGLINGMFQHYKEIADAPEFEKRFEKNYVKDGVNVWLDVLVKKRGDDLLITFLDFTELKKLQVQLEASIDELKKSNASLEEFAYAASHDLQEPLRKINYFSERLRRGLYDKLSTDEARMFERMENAATRMSHLINDLLTYSQISRSTRAFDRCNLNDIIQQVLNDVEATVTTKNATVTTGNLPTIQGDPLQLQQMFQNLLSNSLKYTKAGVPPLIAIECNEVVNEVNGVAKSFYEIKISDNGIGFEQENAEKIFKVFQRLHGQSEFPGTGIGLAIVQKVVENHQGVISAKSTPNAGSTFTILFPA